MIVSSCCHEAVSTQDCESGAYYVCNHCFCSCDTLFSLDLGMEMWNESGTASKAKKHAVKA